MKQASGIKKAIACILLALDGVLVWMTMNAVCAPDGAPLRGGARLACIGLTVLALGILTVSLRAEKPIWFWLLSLGCLFGGNVVGLLGAAASWQAGVQIAQVLILCLSLLLHGVPQNKSGALSVLAVIVLLSMGGGSLLMPWISSMEKPKVYDQVEDWWFSIFENVETKKEEVIETGAKELPVIAGKLLGNVITNDPFDGEDPSVICVVTTTYPLGQLLSFSCGDYDVETHSFALEELDEEANSRGIEERYFNGALAGTGEQVRLLPQKVTIEDLDHSLIMVLRPTVDFMTEDLRLTSYKDRFLYYADQGKGDSYTYGFDPESCYTMESPSYHSYVRQNDLTVPDALREGLLNWLEQHNVPRDKSDKVDLIHQIRAALAEEYTFTHTPPELPEGEDPVLWFLTDSREGYSNHFAAAETLLYRLCGIPSSYAYGYRIDAYNQGRAVVTAGDAAAYCQVYLNGQWVLSSEATNEQHARKPADIGPQNEPTESAEEAPLVLSNGYDISHLRNTLSMFGAYPESGESPVARTARNTKNSYVALVAECDEPITYLKAYSTEAYVSGTGVFTMGKDPEEASELAQTDDLGTYTASKQAAEEGTGTHTLSVYNLHAGMWIYTPYGSPALSRLSYYKDLFLTSDSQADYLELQLPYGPSAEEEDPLYEAYIKETYLDVPEELTDALRAFLKEQKISYRSKDKNQTIARLQQLFAQQFTYNDAIQEIPRDWDPVLWFLTRSKEGYCQHFAAAATLLLRVCDIPARYTVGYKGPFAADTVCEVTSLQAHAWVEIYTETGWVPLDFSAPAEPGTYAVLDCTVSRLPRALIIAAMLIVLLALLRKPIAAWTRSLKPTALNRVETAYLLTERYAYISEEARTRMNKVRYSREGAAEEDAVFMEQELARARSLLKYRHRYGAWILSYVVAWTRYSSRKKNKTRNRP